MPGASLGWQLAPLCRLYALSRARACEGVAPHSLLARHFCRTAGACCLCLLIRLTVRQRGFRRGFLLVPLRLGQANGHGSCKQGYSENLQHGFFLPR